MRTTNKQTVLAAAIITMSLNFGDALAQLTDENQAALDGHNHVITWKGGQIERVVVSGENGSGAGNKTTSTEYPVRYAASGNFPSEYSQYPAGSVFRIDMPEGFMEMKHGDALSIDLPSGHFNLVRDGGFDHDNGDQTWVGAAYGDDNYRTILTEGENGSMTGSIKTPGGEYLIEAYNGNTWMIDVNAAGLKVPQVAAHDDYDAVAGLMVADLAAPQTAAATTTTIVAVGPTRYLINPNPAMILSVNGNTTTTVSYSTPFAAPPGYTQQKDGSGAVMSLVYNNKPPAISQGSLSKGLPYPIRGITNNLPYISIPIVKVTSTPTQTTTSTTVTTTTTTTTTTIPVPSSSTTGNSGVSAVQTVDILAIYTPDFATKVGPVTRINNLTAIANQSYKDSGLNVQLRTVAALAGANLKSATLNQQELTDMYIGQGSFADNKHKALRDQYGADIVVEFRPLKIASQGGNCGIAYIMATLVSSTKAAFAVVGDGNDGGYSCQDVTYVHEIGHVMGQLHDRANAGTSAGVHKYAYAWNATGANAFGTIMAYPGPRVNKFSGPNLKCTGNQPCGYPETDATRASDQVKSMGITIPYIVNNNPTKTPTGTMITGSY